MHGRLILLLSMFGLAMGLATVFFIPTNIEPAFWVVIFLFCAYSIARQARVKPFQHGLLLGLANSVWITACHVLFFDRYLASHTAEAQMVKGLPVSGRLIMAINGPVVGLISGVIIGLLALVASRFLKPSTV